MRRPLAALATFVAGLFKRTPKKRTYESPLPDPTEAPRDPSLRGNGKRARALRKARRKHIKSSFTRCLARRPMLTAPYGKVPAPIGPYGLMSPETAHDRQLDRFDDWTKLMKFWSLKWQEARANSTTVRRAR